MQALDACTTIATIALQKLLKGNLKTAKDIEDTLYEGKTKFETIKKQSKNLYNKGSYIGFEDIIEKFSHEFSDLTFPKNIYNNLECPQFDVTLQENLGIDKTIAYAQTNKLEKLGILMTKQPESSCFLIKMKNNQLDTITYFDSHGYTKQGQQKAFMKKFTTSQAFIKFLKDEKNFSFPENSELGLNYNVEQLFFLQEKK